MSFLGRVLTLVLWYLRQLLPLIYRTYYGDEDGNIHFAVWRMWFGRCFAIDDVVVDPFGNDDNDAVTDLADEMGLYDDLFDEDECDGDCLNCPFGPSSSDLLLALLFDY